MLRAGSWVFRVRHGFEDQLEDAMIERLTRSGFALDEAFAQPFAIAFERAVVTVGIVAGAPEEDRRGPGASGSARVRVVAGAAVAGQILDGTIARVAECRCAL